MSGSDSTLIVRQLALQQHMLSEQQLDAAQRQRDKLRSVLPLDEFLLDLGLIDGEQYRQLVLLQRRALQTRVDKEESVLFGRQVVKRGLADAASVDACLREQERLAAKGVQKNLGELLVQRGVITSAQVKRVLEDRNQVIMVCPKCGVRFNVLKEWVGKTRCPDCADLLVAADAAAPVGVSASLRSEPGTAGDPIGQVIGGCRLQALLGKGTMGAVYKALHVGLNRLVAVKLLKTTGDNPELVKRLFSEARAIAKLEHPNIVQVHDVGLQGNTFFIVMQYLQGRSLMDRAGELGTLPFEEAAAIVKGIARGLAAAHKAGIIHRDLKMENVIVTEDGRARITDFGLAQDRNASDAMDGYIVGTPYYMSPEQWSGKPATERSDLYALGIILYALTTGRRPFEGENITQIMAQHLKATPAPPHEVNPSLSPDFSAVVRVMLAKDPAKRYRDMNHFLGDFERVLKGETPEATAATARIKLVKCSFCEELNPATETKCKVCKEPLRATVLKLAVQARSDEILCPACKAPSPKGARACGTCGRAFCSKCRRRLAEAQGVCRACAGTRRPGR